MTVHCGPCENTDLLIFDVGEDGVLAILLAEAEVEDAGNLEDLSGDEGPCTAPTDNLPAVKAVHVLIIVSHHTN